MVLDSAPDIVLFSVKRYPQSLWQVGIRILFFFCVVCQVYLPILLGRHLFLLHNFPLLLTVVSLYKMGNLIFTPSMFDLSKPNEDKTDSSGPERPAVESVVTIKTACTASKSAPLLPPEALSPLASTLGLEGEVKVWPLLGGPGQTHIWGGPVGAVALGLALLSLKFMAWLTGE